MAISFQYNKTSLQQIEKHLKVRVRSLPTIKSKESALRLEVKKVKAELVQKQLEFDAKFREMQNLNTLWNEFDQSLLEVKEVHMSSRKIAGVHTPILDGIDFERKPFSLFDNPSWFMDGMCLLEELATLGIEREFLSQKMVLLDHARKKTTQKVNLFEKVQIPGYVEAIRKIKRFMEDEENLSKSAQKIVKTRQQKQQKEEEV